MSGMGVKHAVLGTLAPHPPIPLTWPGKWLIGCNMTGFLFFPSPALPACELPEASHLGL